MSQDDNDQGSRAEDKGLMPEILPAPDREGPSRGSPRARTRSHLDRILATVAGLALGAATVAHADTSVPGGKGKDEGKGKKPPPEQSKPPEIPPGYAVVDPMPDPAYDSGFLRIETTPAGATVIIDGVDIGTKTPVLQWKVRSGTHKVHLSLPSGATKELTVRVDTGQTAKVKTELKAPPPAKGK